LEFVLKLLTVENIMGEKGKINHAKVYFLKGTSTNTELQSIYVALNSFQGRKVARLCDAEINSARRLEFLEVPLINKLRFQVVVNGF